MADGRRNNGGHSTKGYAGRKPKAKEQELIEKLTPYDDRALSKLFEAVDDGERWAVRLFMEYRYGKPKETKEVTLAGEQPIFNIEL